MSLPRFTILQSQDKSRNVRYIPDELGEEEKSFLKLDGSDITSLTIKLEVEEAESGKGLVHLRSCYNNKYWALKSVDMKTWITASATEADEDQTKSTCTLFKPTFIGADDSARGVYFSHVQTGLYVIVSISDANCLLAGSTTSTSDPYFFRYVDWETLVFLPKYVAFKGYNGKYLRNSDHYKSVKYPAVFLELSEEDIGNSAVGNEILTSNNGSIAINAINKDKLWVCGANSESSHSGSIVVHNKKNNPDKRSYFWPVKVGSNMIALRSLYNGRICTTDSGNMLDANSTTITKSAKMVVEELVLSRSIYNVKFRLSDARIYNQSIALMAIGEATNMTKVDNVYQVKLSYTNVKSSTWNASVSLKLGITTTIETGIPFIADGKVQISTEVSSSYQWGETDTQSTTLEDAYTVTVPAMTKVMVGLLATKGTCDVPFSYTQRDTSFDGEIKVTTKDDGIYTGINSYNFYHETKQEPIV